MSKYYFFDSSVMFKETNTDLKLATPEKSTTNASWVDAMQWDDDKTDIPDWEYRVCIMYPYVVYDENGISVNKVDRAKYKLWYFSCAVPHAITGRKWLNYIIDKENSMAVELGEFKNVANGLISPVHPDYHFALCYMESNNGIDWTRPDCGEFYYKERSGAIVPTNIVFIGEHGTGVSKNTHPMAGNGEPLFLFACAHDGVAISTSDDGIHWERPVIVCGEHETKEQVRADSHNHVYWSPEANRYVVMTRAIEFDLEDVLRTVVVIKGPDRLYDESGKNNLQNISKSFSYPNVVLRGPLNAQPYSMPICRLCEGYYIGLASIFDYDQTGPDPFHVHASLTWSRDGINWKYVKGVTAFIPNGKEFKIEKGNDFGMIYCAAPIESDGKIKIFYSGTAEPHYAEYEQISDELRRVLDVSIPKAKEAKRITRTTTLKIATLEKDRLAGRYSQNGKIVTRAVSYVGGELLISADVDAKGELCFRLLDEEGNPIVGYDYDDFDVFVESVTSAPLKCKNDLNSLINKNISLEIKIKNSTVYSYEIKNGGASQKGVTEFLIKQ